MKRGRRKEWDKKIRARRKKSRRIFEALPVGVDWIPLDKTKPCSFGGQDYRYTGSAGSIILWLTIAFIIIMALVVYIKN